jgi:4-hydroxy-tetrahydrodipicolinate synthase
MTKPNPFHGIHAATVAPMRPDFSLDEAALAAHVASVSKVPGIRGLLINGHAGENYYLTRDEMRRVVEVVRGAVPRTCWLTAGVNAESSLEAARQAADAENAGADALLVFPPNSWALHHDAGMVDAHHALVMQASSLPIVLYQAPVGAGRMAYSLATIERLIASPRIQAIKEGSWEVATYEQNWRFLRARRPDIAVLGSGDEHLLASYLIGSAGAQVSLAAIIPELIVALHEAAVARDWSKARELHELIYPLSVAIYRNPPGNRATARLKVCLKLLGRLEHATARPPIQPLPEDETDNLQRALQPALVWLRRTMP